MPERTVHDVPMGFKILPKQALTIGHVNATTVCRSVSALWVLILLY